MLIGGGSGGGSPRLKLEKTDIVVNAFPAIDSAGLYIAQDQGLFAAQGLHVTIVPVPKNGPPPSTQDLVNGQVKGQFDITAGDYVTYIEDQLGFGAPKADLRIIAESSFLQPNVLTLLVKGGSPISQVSQLKGKIVSVNAPNDIGTLLIDSLLISHGLTPQAGALQHQRALPGRGADPHGYEQPGRRLVRPRAVRQRRRGGSWPGGTRRPRPGRNPGLPDPGLCGHGEMGARRTPTR